MNEDLKIDVYKRIVNEAESNEKEAIKKTACILYVNKFANGMKEIYFYSSDFMGEGKDVFQMDYNIEYTNGEFQNGNCMIDIKDVITAFGFADYKELKTYFAEKYKDDMKAWQKIVKEMEEKGLSPSVDESEGDSSFMTNML